MTDKIDASVDIEERLLEKRIKSRDTNPLHINNDSGKCYVCQAQVEHVTVNDVAYFPRWCSVECMKEYETN